jgi:hypothetical protein
MSTRYDEYEKIDPAWRCKKCEAPFAKWRAKQQMTNDMQYKPMYKLGRLANAAERDKGRITEPGPRSVGWQLEEDREINCQRCLRSGRSARQPARQPGSIIGSMRTRPGRHNPERELPMKAIIAGVVPALGMSHATVVFAHQKSRTTAPFQDYIKADQALLTQSGIA